MSRDFPRSRRIEDQILRVLSDVIRAKVRDPRMQNVIVTSVRVSRDLSVAWVYFTSMNPDHVRSELDDAFAAAGKFLRSRLAGELTVRQVPELRFTYDDLTQSSQQMEDLIADAVATDQQRAAASGRDAQPEEADDAADERRGDAPDS